MRGIEMVEANTGRRHGIKIRRLQHGMPVVADVTPAVIVGHAEYEVRTISRLARSSNGHQADAQKRSQDEG